MKFSEVSIGTRFITKHGEFEKVGKTSAKCIFHPSFPQHIGKVCGGFGKNQNVIVKPK